MERFLRSSVPAWKVTANNRHSISRVVSSFINEFRNSLERTNNKYKEIL